MPDKSGTSPTAISLPSGGGSAQGIGDAVRVDPRRGAGSYRVAVQCPSGRGGLDLDVALSYDSSAGFGALGLGWSIPTRRISRRGDLAVPTFTDSDVFLLDGQELYDVGGGEYRPRVDRNFERIRRLADHWQVDGPDGRTYVFGEDASARLSNPSDPTQLQAWFLSHVSDANGNVIAYRYRRDDRLVAIGSATVCAAQVYPDRIDYNPHGAGWLHSVGFVYDYADAAGPVRPDAFLTCRPGFLVLTGFRLAAIEVYAHLPGAFDGCIRRYDLGYASDPDSGHALVTGVTMTGYDDRGSGQKMPPITFQYSQLDTSQAALRDLEGAPHLDLAAGNVDLIDLTANGLPDLLSTQPGNHSFWLNNRWREPGAVAGQADFAPGTRMTSSPNAALLQPETHLADVRSHMAADLLTGSAIFDSPSRTLDHSQILARQLSWGSGTTFASPPPFGFADAKTRVVDLTGSGRMDVLRVDGHFHHWLNKEDGTFEDRGLSPQIPGVTFTLDEWQLADMNGDGLVDLVHVQNGQISYHLNLANGCRSGPLFSDKPVVMSNGVTLAQPAGQWDPGRLLLVDVNGDGYADAIYLFADRIVVAINQGGWGWGPARTVAVTPPAVGPMPPLTSRGSVRVADLDGHGSPGLVCSGPNMPMRFLSLDSGTKPLLLTSVDNGIGGRMEIDYVSSAAFDGREWVTRIPFPIHVVKEIRSLEATTGRIQTARYVFLDGEFDPARREFLGFSETQVTEVGDSAGWCETRVTITNYHTGLGGVDPRGLAKAAALAGLPVRRAISGADTARPVLVTEWAYDFSVAPRFERPATEAWGHNGLSARDAAGNWIDEPVATSFQAHELELHYDPADARGGQDRLAALTGKLSTTVCRDGAGRFDPYGRPLALVAAYDVTVSSTRQAGRVCTLTIDPGAATLSVLDPVPPARRRLDITALPAGVHRTDLSYAADTAAHLVTRPARRLTRVDGKVIEDVRLRYDGRDYSGLPVGQVQAGNITRQETLVLRADQVTAAYGDWPGGQPDLRAIGYRYAEYGTRKGPARIVPPIKRLGTPEGYGYFIDQIRYRYARKPDGSLAYGFVAGQLDPSGAEWTYLQDSFFLHTVSQQNPDGEAVLAAPDYRVGRLASITDANGRKQWNAYDAFGRLAYAVKPGDTDALPTISYTYHRAGDPLPAFVRTSRREVSGQPGTFDSVEYADGWGRPLQTRVEAEDGRIAVTAAEEANLRGGLLARVLPYFDTSDAYAPPPATALRISRRVDVLDCEIALAYPDGAQVTRTCLGLSVEESDREDSATASSHSGTATRSVRDTRGDLVEVHERLGTAVIVAAYGYDALGKLAWVRPNRRTRGVPAIQYVRDLLGRALRVEHADSAPVCVLFTPRGQVARRADGRKQVVTYQYDQSGRLTTRSYPTSGDPCVKYEYGLSGGPQPAADNVVGRLRRVTDQAGAVEFAYDARGHLRRHARTWDERGAPRTYAMEFVYDAADRLIQSTYPQLGGAAVGMIATQRFNAGNLLETVSLQAAGGGAVSDVVAAIHWDARGQRTQLNYGNGLQTQLCYRDTTQHLLEATTRDAKGKALRHHVYGHDREGNVTVDADLVTGRAKAYDYDDLYRLVRSREFDLAPAPGQLVKLPLRPEQLDGTDAGAFVAALALQPLADEPFAYSVEGDVQKLGQTGAVSYAAIAGRRHGKLQAGGRSYTFNEAGALDTVTNSVGGAAIAPFSYDGDGRLRRSERPPDDLAIEFVHDYEGERVVKRITRLSTGALLAETRYVGRWLTLEADSAGAGVWKTVRQFILDGKDMLAVADAAGSLCATVHPDHLGSTSLVAGAVTESLQYQPFGAEANPTAAAWMRRRFAGKESDAEMGLVDFGSRFYLPDIGRWCAPDPELWSTPEGHLANPQNLNAYSYALNNPVTLSDPTGRSPGKYAADYIDTRRTFNEVTRRPDGAVEIVTYRIVEAKPGTWLSKITSDFGWGQVYSKQQGYGAYDRNVIRPLNSYAAAANGFSPDHIQPGQFFAVRERASTIHLDLEPDEPIKGDLPNHFSKDWSWKCLFGAGGGVEIGGEAITFSFKNDRSGKETQFTYFGFGGGPGLPISIAMPSDNWAKMPKLDHAIKVDDFEGPAQHFSAGAAYGYDSFILQGPFRSGKTDKPLALESWGFSGSCSVGFTSGTLIKRSE